MKSIKAEDIPVQQTEFTQIKLIWEILVDERVTTYKVLKLCHGKWDLITYIVILLFFVKGMSYWTFSPLVCKSKSQFYSLQYNSVNKYKEKITILLVKSKDISGCQSITWRNGHVTWKVKSLYAMPVYRSHVFSKAFVEEAE